MCTVSPWTSSQGWKYPIDEKDLLKFILIMSFVLFGGGVGGAGNNGCILTFTSSFNKFLLSYYKC